MRSIIHLDEFLLTHKLRRGAELRFWLIFASKSEMQVFIFRP